MGKFAEIWQDAADDLGLDIVAPFLLTIAGKPTFQFHVLLKNFGGKNGMLLHDDSKATRPYWDDIQLQGYGFSHFEYEADATYDRESVIEALVDWTWRGPANEKPDWLSQP